MLCIMAIAGVLADAIQLPGIVGAFLAGLAINASAHDKPASAKLTFLANSLFIPIFFIYTAFLINPVTFVLAIFDNFLLVAGIVAALLVGKWIAAWVVGRAFGYNRNEQLTVWSLTLPQVAHLEGRNGDNGDVRRLRLVPHRRLQRPTPTENSISRSRTLGSNRVQSNGPGTHHFSCIDSY